VEEKQYCIATRHIQGAVGTSRSMPEIMGSKDRSEQVKEVFKNLTDVEAALQLVVQEHRHGRYGFITREWGFTAPGGLGGQLGGKWAPWEEKLARVKKFFWPLEAYDAMENQPYGKADPKVIEALALAPEGEQLYGNTPLHNFLREPPKQDVIIEESDLDDYRTAARVFLLIGTLSHLYGNSAPDRTSHTLPAWIEEPLLIAANRLQVEPTLSGHFLVQENWIWTSPDTEDSYASLTKASSTRQDRVIVRTLLDQCQCADRRYRVKIYPDCFIGSQAVDILVDNGLAVTREEAVRVGRRINQQFKLFNHVTNDHPLMDKHLFFRFTKKWQQKKADAVLMAESLSEPLTEASVDEVNGGKDDAEPNTPTSRLIRPGDILKSLRNSTTSDNGETQKILRRISSRQRSSSGNDSTLERATSHRSLSPASDGTISEEEVKALESPFCDVSCRADAGQISTRLTLHDDTWELQEAMSTMAVMALVPVKDRRHRFRTYKQCFVASQMIDALIEHECEHSRQDAVQLARRINERFGPIFEHVVDNHQLKDEYLFFRFTPTFKDMMQNKNGDEVKSTSHTSTASKRHSLKGRPPSLASEKKSTQQVLDENLRGTSTFSPEPSSIGSMDSSFNGLRDFDEGDEFRIDNISMLYPAFGHNHEVRPLLLV
jgi:Domain found in Dishevelled, Egl-10, and Pleckstrin (DEP)/Indoleamine 2,3-dioxygenase